MISIITPVYNGEKFIETCIRAVIDQKCPDVEHIIVDGASTDGTVEIIKQYANMYSHIRWISEKDEGQSDAMNKGILMAKGKIMSFLNVDDFYEPNVLNRALELFKELPVPSLLLGNCNVWDDKGQLLAVFKPANFHFLNLLQGFNEKNTPPNPSAYFYHTSLHQQIGLYKVDEHYSMDTEFLFRAVQVATVKYVDESWGNWLFYEGTKSHTIWQSPQEGYRDLDRLFRYYRKDLPFLQRCQVAIQYELLFVLWGRHLKWRPKYYFKTYLSRPQNIFPALGAKLMTWFNRVKNSNL
jgi:glycosyltransferase involved in cell wall biosynthesis